MSDEANNSLEHDEPEEPELEEYFNKERTLSLIELFKKYKPLVATGSIKTVKQMWEIVSDNMINLHQISITPQKCENRFKVLERAYKRTSDIINSGQEPKKIFPYFEEFKTVPRNKKYEFVPGLNSSNYSAYTTVNFSNTITAPICPSTTATYIELQNVEQDLTENKETPNSFEKLNTAEEPQCSIQQQVRLSAQHQPPQNVKIGLDIYFNRERTLTLIELYKKYNQKYRERGIKTKKRMWYLIAREMTCKFNVPITGAKCENKLKVLQRNYTRGSYFKKRYEFEEELKEIFGEKVTKIPEKTLKMPRILNNSFTPILNNATTGLASNSATPQQVTIRLLDPQKTTSDKIEAILSGIRSDFQTYFKERLSIEREKLALKKQKLIFSKDRKNK